MQPNVDRITTYEELLALLQRDEVLHQPELRTKTVTIPTKRGELDGVMVLKWQDQDGVMQLIQTLPFEVPEDRVTELESALCRINHELALPGFGFNHEHRAAYYRMAAPTQPGGGLDAAEIRMYFEAVLRLSADFYKALKRVASEEASAVTVLADAQIDSAMN